MQKLGKGNERVRNYVPNSKYDIKSKTKIYKNTNIDNDNKKIQIMLRESKKTTCCLLHVKKTNCWWLLCSFLTLLIVYHFGILIENSKFMYIIKHSISLKDGSQFIVPNYSQLSLLAWEQLLY